MHSKTPLRIAVDTDTEMSVSSSSEKILCRSCFLRFLFES